MNRRRALTWMGIAAAGEIARRFGPAEVQATARAAAQAQANSIDWAARVSALARPANDEVVLTAVGDLMLSRPEASRPGAAVQEMYRIMRDADVGFGNCEEVISSIGFYAQRMGYPEMLDDFKAAGLNMLSLSNNHFMDMGPQPALQGLTELKARGFTYSGCGRNLEEALTPGVRIVKDVRVGMLAFWAVASNFAPPAYMDQARAGANKPGMAMIAGVQVQRPGSPTPILLPLSADMATMAGAIERARAQCDFLLVSFHQHWGGQEGAGQGIIPAQEPPRRTAVVPANLSSARNQVSEGRQLISRAAIDAGADLVVAHGPHILNGVEIYKGKPILHSLGHFYIEGMLNGKALPQFYFSPSMVSSIENGWWAEEQRWSAIARMFIKGRTVTRLELIPVTMDIQKDGLPEFPAPPVTAQIMGAIETLSKPFGTAVRSRGWYSEIIA